MTLEQIDALGSELTGFLRLFEQCFHAGNVSHLRQYTRGLLSDLERKTAEPIALQAGVPPRNVQQFLVTVHGVWN